MRPDYLQPQPSDSNADAILCQMLPDYMAEIRRCHHLTHKNTELDFSKLPIVVEAESYLRGRIVRRDSGQEQITPSHNALVVKNRKLLDALIAIKNYQVDPAPVSPFAAEFKSYPEVIRELKAIASKALAENI